MGQAICINCNRPIGEHVIIPNEAGDICAPARVCPTATFRVTEESIDEALAADLKEHRSEAKARRMYGDDAEQCICGEWGHSGGHFDGTYFTCDPEAECNTPGYDREKDGNRG